MDVKTILRLLNILLAILTLPASIYLLKVALAERKISNGLAHKLNTILLSLFIGVGLGSILNALISLVVILGGGKYAHELSYYRSVTMNTFFAFVSWALYLFHKKISKK